MSADIKVRCPKCKSVLRVLREALDRPIHCQYCTRAFRAVLKSQLAAVPSAAAPPSLPAGHESKSPESEFAFSDLSPAASGSASVRVVASATSSSRGMMFVGLLALLAAAGGALGLYYSGWLKSTPAVHSRPASNLEVTDAIGGAETTAQPVTNPAPSTVEPFPRRMLFIGIHNYVYANPIGPTPTTLLMPRTIREFAEQKLKIERDQLTILSDLAGEREARPPLKSIIEMTVDRFLATTRPQDRILIMFVGHAIELDNAPFLVPIEGDLADKTTLIPLQWLFDRLTACHARQKVLVLDTNRLDSSRGFERPGGGPLGARLENALSNPPAGLQVWTACSAGQHSYEFEQASAKDIVVRGGAFLSSLFQARLPVPKPEDPLPVESLAQQIHSQVAELVKSRESGAEQRPRLTGHEPASGSAYDPDQPMPPRIELPKPAAMMPGGVADRAEIERLLAEISIPPLKLPRDNAKTQHLPDQQVTALAATFPFSAEKMKDYAADYGNLRDVLDRPKEYPLRIAVLSTVEALDRQGRQNRIKVGDKEVSGESLIEKVRNLGTDDAVKKSLTKSQQDGPALMLVELQDMLELMERAGRTRDREPSKRWQAHFDYVLAQLKMRMVYVHEYNVMIAKVKRDELPKLDPKLHNGWRLAAQEKIASPKEVKDLAGDARKLMAKLIQEHPGTPWEVLAKRERFTALGLAWQPTSLRDD
jgi:hypothetical protein